MSRNLLTAAEKVLVCHCNNKDVTANIISHLKSAQKHACRHHSHDAGLVWRFNCALERSNRSAVMHCSAADPINALI